MALSGSVKTSSYEGRYYQLDWTATQSIANNTSTISWTLKAVGGSASWYAERTLKVVIGGTTAYSKTDRVERYAGTVKSGTTTISHNTDGTKSFSISVQAAVYGTSVNCTGSSAFTLDQIARTSSLSVANGTLGTAQTLAISEQVSSFEHKLTYSCGSVAGFILGSSTGTSKSNSISWTPPLFLASENTTGKTVSIKFTLYTYTSSGESVGSITYTKTFTIPNKLSCSVSVSDATGKSSTYGGYIKGVSKLNVTVKPDTTNSYSPIASYSTTANETTYTTASFTTEALKESGNLTISAKVTDKRGDSYTKTQSVTVLDYTAPIISKLSVRRCDGNGNPNDEGDHIEVTFSGAITSLSNKNSASFVLQYRKTTEDYYTPIALSSAYTVTDGTYIFAADTSSSYEVCIEATDNFATTCKSTNASSAFTIMHFNASGNGMGLGKVCEIAGLDVGFDTVFRKPVAGASFNSDGGLGLGRSDITGKTEVNVDLYWADGTLHDIITRGNSGLTTALGWTGSAIHKTVTNLRGQTIQCNGSTTWSSDKNLKYDIQDFDEKYALFYANLQPRSYKYNLGSSGRTHIGYVTQEVEDALTKAGLSTQDFAGVVIQPIYGRETEKDENGNAVDIEISEDNHLLDKGIEERHNLAYTEFIALNTYMIQKLLKENVELKEKVNNLEEKLEKLVNV